MSFTINLDRLRTQSHFSDENNVTVLVNTAQMSENYYVRILGFDHHNIAKEFCNFYYLNMSIRGLVEILHIFDPMIQCNYLGIEFLGMQNVLIKMHTDGICKLQYDKLTQLSLQIDELTMMIQVCGLCQAVNFNGMLSNICIFNESFIIKFINGRFVVVGYIFKLL